MAVVIICCMILVGFIFIYGGWKRSYDEISSAPDIWIVEIFFDIIGKIFKISAENLLRISLMIFGTVWSLFFLFIVITHAY